MKRPTSFLARRRAQAAFTLVELIAAIALLIILLAILFVVFGEAGRAVAIGQTRLERYRTVRAVFRLLEEDISSAFLLDEGGTTYGFTGQDATDPAFLVNAVPPPFPDSDRLTIVRHRRGFDLSAPKPGYVDVCYLRVNIFTDLPGRPNVLLRVMDQEEAGTIGSYEDWATGWAVGDPLRLGFGGEATFPIMTTLPVGTYPTYLNDHDDEFMNYLLALNVSDLQFDYLQAGSSTWMDEVDGVDDEDGGNWDCNANQLPTAVRVTIRLGPANSSNPQDHDAFTHIVFLPTAP